MIDQQLTLLEASGKFEPDDAPCLRQLRFSMPTDAGALVRSFDYQPRASDDAEDNSRRVDGAVREQLEAARADGVHTTDVRSAHAGPLTAAHPELAPLRRTLRNLLNLTLVDAEGQPRGRWDRNLLGEPPAPDVLTEGSATPGFVAGPLPAGEWLVTVEAHQLLGPCSYRLSLVALDDGAAAPTIGAPGGSARSTPPQARSRKRRPPAAREYQLPLPAGWLRGELHCHTTASDGRYEPLELIERAAQVGLDFVALTDHNTLADDRVLEDAPLPLIRGCEVTTFHGHFTAHGIERPPAWYEGERPLGPSELATALHATGALFGIAHPFVLGAPICSGCRLGAGYDPAQLDLLDVWSRGHEDQLADRHALALFDRLRADGHPVVAVAGRDWHGPKQEPSHSGRRYPATVVRAEPDPPRILEALRRGAVYLSVGPVLDLQVHAEGPGGTSSATLGEHLDVAATGAPAGCARVRAEILVVGLGEPALLRLIGGGRPLVEHPLAKAAARSLLLALPEEASAVADLRLELLDEQRRPLVITNPVRLVGGAR